MLDPFLNTNVTALTANRNYKTHRKQINISQEKLATGIRLNRTSDGPVLSSLSKKIDNELKGVSQGFQNAQDGISLLNIADSGLDVITNYLSRMRELATSAATDTNSQSQRNAIAAEIASLAQELDRTANSTNFNNLVLLNGSIASLVVQINGGTASSANSVNLTAAIGDVRNSVNGIFGGSAGFTNYTDIWNPATQTTLLTSSTVSRNFINDVDSALNIVIAQRARVGALANHLEKVTEVLQDQIEQLGQTNAIFRDTDIAAEQSIVTRSQILENASISVLSQTNSIARSTIDRLLT